MRTTSHGRKQRDCGAVTSFIPPRVANCDVGGNRLAYPRYRWLLRRTDEKANPPRRTRRKDAKTKRPLARAEITVADSDWNETHTRVTYRLIFGDTEKEKETDDHDAAAALRQSHSDNWIPNRIQSLSAQLAELALAAYWYDPDAKEDRRPYFGALIESPEYGRAVRLLRKAENLWNHAQEKSLSYRQRCEAADAAQAHLDSLIDQVIAAFRRVDHAAVVKQAETLSAEREAAARSAHRARVNAGKSTAATKRKENADRDEEIRANWHGLVQSHPGEKHTYAAKLASRHRLTPAQIRNIVGPEGGFRKKTKTR